MDRSAAVGTAMTIARVRLFSGERCGASPPDALAAGWLVARTVGE
jgi:hypothetical protein